MDVTKDDFTRGGVFGLAGVMAYDLFIGDQAFSSWSLRGWLMFEKFDIPCRTHMVGLYDGTMREDLADLAPASPPCSLNTHNAL